VVRSLRGVRSPCPQIKKKKQVNKKSNPKNKTKSQNIKYAVISYWIDFNYPLYFCSFLPYLLAKIYSKLRKNQFIHFLKVSIVGKSKPGQSHHFKIQSSYICKIDPCMYHHTLVRIKIKYHQSYTGN
jgi:hypothetical protein